MHLENPGADVYFLEHWDTWITMEEDVVQHPGLDHLWVVQPTGRVRPRGPTCFSTAGQISQMVAAHK